MVDIVIYTSAHCPYCDRAKMLLKNKNAPFKEVRIDQDSLQKDKMIEITGRKTVPQIFINHQHIGGCDDLYALDKQGKLDAMLS